MKKIALLVATVVVLFAATFIAYQSLFMQKPTEVLAEISKRVDKISSVIATTNFTLDANNARLINATGAVQGSGKPVDVADFIGSKPHRNPSDKFSEDFTVEVEGNSQKMQAVLDNNVFYLKTPTLGDKWISEKYEILNQESTASTTNLPVEAKYLDALVMATEHLKGFNDAQEIGIEQDGVKQLRHLYMPLKEEEWKKAVDGAYPSLKISASNVSVDTNIWVDSETFLPTKYVITLKVDKPCAIAATCTMTFSSFNQALTITAPAADQTISLKNFQYNNKLSQLLKQATGYFQARDYKKAQAALSEVAYQWPDNPVVIEILAEIEIALGEYDLAKTYVDKAEALNSKSPAVYMMRSHLASLDGKYSAALIYAKKATELNPLSPEAFYELGVAYNGLNNSVLAMDSFENALDLNPNYPDPAAMLSICYARNKNFDKALRYYKKGINNCNNPAATKMANNMLMSVNKTLADIKALPQDILRTLSDVSKPADLQTTLNARQKPVLIFFYAKKCPISLELADALNNMKDKYGETLAFYVFDVDSGQDVLSLINTYGVKSTPTLLIINSDGTISKQCYGYLDDRVLEKWILDAK